MYSDKETKTGWIAVLALVIAFCIIISHYLYKEFNVNLAFIAKKNFIFNDASKNKRAPRSVIFEYSDKEKPTPYRKVSGYGFVPVAEDDSAISNEAKELMAEIASNKSNNSKTDKNAKARYREYVLECIMDKALDLYKTKGVMAELIIKINKQGYLEAYNIHGASYPETRAYNVSNEDNNNFKQCLEKALLEASPFQPFPPDLDKGSVEILIEMGNDYVKSWNYNNQGKPNWTHKVNQINQPKNPKRYEGTKIIKPAVYIVYWHKGKQVESKKLDLMRDVKLDWRLVKKVTENVIIRAEITRGMNMINPAYILKSDNESANSASIKLLDSINGSNLYKYLYTPSDFPSHDMVTIELHFDVK